MTTINVEKASGKELLEFYNKHAVKPIKKFADLTVAKRRVTALLEELSSGTSKKELQEAHGTDSCPYCEADLLRTEVESFHQDGKMMHRCGACGKDWEYDAEEESKKVTLPVPPASDPAAIARRSDAIAKSWENPDIKRKRMDRHQVLIRKEGQDDRMFRSVRAAFKALDLPLGKHINFRRELKKTKDMKTEAFGYHWELTKYEPEQ